MPGMPRALQALASWKPSPMTSCEARANGLLARNAELRDRLRRVQQDLRRGARSAAAGRARCRHRGRERRDAPRPSSKRRAPELEHIDAALERIDAGMFGLWRNLRRRKSTRSGCASFRTRRAAAIVAGGRLNHGKADFDPRGRRTTRAGRLRCSTRRWPWRAASARAWSCCHERRCTRTVSRRAVRRSAIDKSPCQRASAHG